MMTVTERIWLHLYRDVGFVPKITYTEIVERNRIPKDWLEALQARLNMGALRYGVHMDERRAADFDHLKSIEKHLAEYRTTKNIEHLMDIANLALVERQRPSFEGTCFDPIDDGTHSDILRR